jgi:adenylyltransferase/sulfurtransferase
MKENKEIKSVTVHELNELKRHRSKDFRLIDVRKKEEYDYCNIGGELIPMSEIADRVSELEKDKMIIFHCHHGSRSKKVIEWLQDTHDFNNLYNLEGGIHAWSTELDSDIPIY